MTATVEDRRPIIIIYNSCTAYILVLYHYLLNINLTRRPLNRSRVHWDLIILKIIVIIIHIRLIVLYFRITRPVKRVEQTYDAGFGQWTMQILGTKVRKIVESCAAVGISPISYIGDCSLLKASHWF